MPPPPAEFQQPQEPGADNGDAPAGPGAGREEGSVRAPRSIGGWAGQIAVQPRVLLASRSAALADPLSRRLVQDGMRVALVGTHTDLFKRLGDHPSVVVLDLDLPGADGLELLKRLRSASDAPVVLVTGRGRHDADRIVGLELGADDYLDSPIDPRELSARIRGILRRHNRAPGALRLRPPTRARFGVWELDCLTRRLKSDGGVTVDLTRSEYTLLLAFLDRPHEVLSREDLLHATRVHEDMSDRSIDVQVVRLRRKLQTGGGDREVIATLRGVGYSLRAEVEAS